jgi:DNA-binding NarL/FixJ family response regulator
MHAMARSSALDMTFERALVVEDDPVLRRVLVRGLRGWGLEALEACDVHDAGRALQLRPDLVLTDVRLPDGSGHEVVRRAARMPRLPFIVAMSGEATAAEAFELARAAVRLYLEKPFTLEELAQRIAATIALEQHSAGTPQAHAQVLPEDAQSALLEQVRRLTHERALSRRETECVRLAMLGTPRAALPEALGITENTCKTLVRSVLRKCECDHLSDLRTLLLIRARWDESGAG